MPGPAPAGQDHIHCPPRHGDHGREKLLQSVAQRSSVRFPPPVQVSGRRACGLPAVRPTRQATSRGTLRLRVLQEVLQLRGREVWCAGRDIDADPGFHGRVEPQAAARHCGLPPQPPEGRLRRDSIDVDQPRHPVAISERHRVGEGIAARIEGWLHHTLLSYSGAYREAIVTRVAVAISGPCPPQKHRSPLLMLSLSVVAKAPLHDAKPPLSPILPTPTVEDLEFRGPAPGGASGETTLWESDPTVTRTAH